MKAFLILVLALFAMASAQSDKVKVAEKPEPVHVVDNNPGYVNVVDNNPPSGDFVIYNPDPAFSRPSAGPSSVNGQPPYPYKQYNDPYLRGGK